MDTAGWQEGTVGISQLCYCWLLPGLFAESDMCQQGMWILMLFFKQVELAPIKISPESLNLLLAA